MDGPRAGLGPGRTLADGLAALLAVGGLVLAALVVASAVTGYYDRLSAMPSEGVVVPGAIESRRALRAAVYYGALSSTLITLSLAIARLIGHGRGVVEVLRLGPPVRGKSSYLAAGAAVVAVLALWFAALGLWWPGKLAAEARDYPSLVSSPRGYILGLVLCFLVPVAEEIAFRALLFCQLAETRLGVPGAAAVSTGLWLVLHTGYTAFALTQLSLAGLALCWMVWRSQSVRVSILCHVIFNSAMTVVILSPLARP